MGESGESILRDPNITGSMGSGWVEIVQHKGNMDVKKPVDAETSTGSTVISEDQSESGRQPGI